ncbi:hypothetical protein B7Z28_00255 [Candidatus Saccharibacteria bacterium 32-45-3]|nr:MAG: hypothetical protein B7Z28_00255 [Candidatus Saccharibacteria bacterium 32-45-3]
MQAYSIGVIIDIHNYRWYFIVTMADIEHYSYYVDIAEQRELLQLRRSTDELANDIGFVAINALTAGIASPERRPIATPESDTSAERFVAPSTINNLGAVAYLNYSELLRLPYKYEPVDVSQATLGYGTNRPDFDLAA